LEYPLIFSLFFPRGRENAGKQKRQEADLQLLDSCFCDRARIEYPFHDRIPKAKSKPENGFAFLSEFISLEQVQLISSNKKVAQQKSCATLL